MKRLIQENLCAQHENTRVRKCTRKSKFIARNKTILIQIVIANRRATSHELKISLKAYGENALDSSVRRKLISAGLSVRRPHTHTHTQKKE